MTHRILVAFMLIISFGVTTDARERWTEEQANTWYQKTGWLVGCNFNPSTAINQLEMWQADTFDPETIDRELGWAEELGLNSMRVYLHNLPWEQDRDGFLERIDQYLTISEKHGIGTVFVLLDGVWHPSPKPGVQPAPRPHVHNSGWVQAPGRAILDDPQRHDELKPYVQGVIGRFKDDHRVNAWDVFNEPDNPNANSYGENGSNEELSPQRKAKMAMMLARKVFQWARDANPSQPLTAAPWRFDWSESKIDPFNKMLLDESDVISFHTYDGLDAARDRISQLSRFNRPMICTEYMARPNGSTFDPILGFFKEQNVSAFNWGFVAGKTQTNYPWDSWQKTYTDEPPVWFHEILRIDGTPYREEEVRYIKSLTH